MARARQPFLRIARHELRILRAERTLRPVSAMLVVLLALALWNGISWVSNQKKTIESAFSEENARFKRARHEVVHPLKQNANVEARNDPRDPASFGATLGKRYAVLPPGPLERLSIGQSDLYPYYLAVSTRSRDTFVHNDEIENPLNLLAGRFDTAFVIVYLFPLVILGLSFNLLSGEREQGTMALLLSQPVALRSFAAGKIFSRAIVIVGLVVAVSVAGAIVAAPDAPASIAVRTILWCLTVAAYAAVWFALAVAVNASRMSSASNASALLAVWLLLVIIIPSSVTVAAQSLYPVPSRVQMIQAIRDASREASAHGSQLLGRYFEDHPELIPGGTSKAEIDNFNAQTYAVQEAVDRQVQPVLDRYDAQLLRQQSLVDRLKFLSPAIVTQEALNRIAGTDLGRYRYFIAQVDRFHRKWKDYFNTRSVQKVPMTVDAIDAVPSFAFAEQPFSRVLLDVAVGLAGLFVPAFVIALIASWRMRKYQPTS